MERDWDRSRTGAEGLPSAPYVVSFDVIGAAGRSGADYRAAVTDLRTLVEGLREDHLLETWRGSRQWNLLRTTPAHDVQSWTFRSGRIRPGLWEESVDGIGEEFDGLDLSAYPFGRIGLDHPALDHDGDVHSMHGFLRVPEDAVVPCAEALVEMLRSTARSAGMRTGFVHIDSIVDPYRTALTSRSRLTEDPYIDRVPGYYWSVVLTAGQLGVLGGVTRVEEESPCHRVELLEGAEGPVVLCTLTESPLDMDEAGVLAWKDYLQPVLRDAYPDGWETLPGHGGHRIGTHFVRPVWLFEGAPVTIGTVGVLRHGTSGAGAPVDLVIVDRPEDPTRLRCRLEVGDAFSLDEHGPLVAAVVRAWFLTGLHGLLHGVDGVLAWRSPVVTGDGADGRVSLEWRFDPGSTPVLDGLRLLARALGDASAVLETDADDEVLRVLLVS